MLRPPSTNFWMRHCWSYTLVYTVRRADSPDGDIRSSIFNIIQLDHGMPTSGLRLLVDSFSFLVVKFGCRSLRHLTARRYASAGTSYGPVSVRVFDEPEFYIETADGIELVFFGVGASFNLYTPSCKKIREPAI